MAKLAEAENAVVKISGLGMGDQMEGGNWTIDSIRPYVYGCIEASAWSDRSSAATGR